MPPFSKDIVRHLPVSENEAGQRLDNFLARILKGVPKSHVCRIIRAGEVRVDKKRARPDTRIAAGSIIRIPPVRVSQGSLKTPVPLFLKTTRYWLSTSLRELPYTAAAA